MPTTLRDRIVSSADVSRNAGPQPIGEIAVIASLRRRATFGWLAAAAALIAAFEAALASGCRTPDLGGTAGTQEFTTAVVDNLASG